MRNNIFRKVLYALCTVGFLSLFSGCEIMAEVLSTSLNEMATSNSSGSSSNSTATVSRCTVDCYVSESNGRYYVKFRKDCNCAVTVYYKVYLSDGRTDVNGMEYMPANYRTATGRSYVTSVRDVTLTNYEIGDCE